MRWRDLLRGRTITSSADVPARYSGRLVLLRLDPDALGIRDHRTGRALTWDDPVLETMGVSVLEVTPVAGSQPAFRGGSAEPGTAVGIEPLQGTIRVLDEHGLVLGDAVSAPLATAQARAGHRLRGVSLQQVRDATGARTGLHVLLLPPGVEAEIRVHPSIPR